MKKPRILQFSLWSLLLVFFLILCIKDVEAKTITVDDDGGQDYESIQDAIDDATEGDIIRVYEGIYYENLLVNKTVNLIGNGTDNTTIDAKGNGTVVNLSADNVEISNFLITGSGDNRGYYAGIRVYSSNNIISNCDISKNKNGILLRYTSNNSILNCNITNHEYKNSDTNLINGISFYYSSNNLILNCNITNCDYHGIHFYLSSNNTISSCNISNNYEGIRLEDSSNCAVSNNIFINNGIAIISKTLSHFVHSIENNTVNGKPLLYYWNKNNKILNGIEVGQIILVNCSNFEIKNINISNAPNGIIFAFCEGNTISNCNISNNDWRGIILQHSNNNTILKCNISNNGNGISLRYSNDNKVSSCNILNIDWHGIYVWSSSKRNKISNSNISNNNYGIYINDKTYDNLIFHNYFKDNNMSAFDLGSNYWDNGKEGNYWDDYDGNDTNGDGIGDTPYNIPDHPYKIPIGKNQDRYPLIEPYEYTGSTTGTIKENEIPNIVYFLLVIVIILILLIININYWYPTKK